jgi:hypothetical protein
MRARLNRSALAGEKVATGALPQQEYLDELEPVEVPGERQVFRDQMMLLQPSSRSRA